MQVETGHNLPRASSGSNRHFTEIEFGCHTFPKSRSTKEEMKTNAEDEMSARENDMESEQVLLREECGKVILREKKLKQKEKDFEVKKAYGE